MWGRLCKTTASHPPSSASSAFFLPSRGLRLQSAATAAVEINGALRVRRLFPSSAVSPPPPQPLVFIVSCTAPIQLPWLPSPTRPIAAVRPLNQSAARGGAGPSPGSGSKISCFIPGHLRKVGHGETTERCGRGRLYSGSSSRRSSGWLLPPPIPSLRVGPVDLVGVLFRGRTLANVDLALPTVMATLCKEKE